MRWGFHIALVYSLWQDLSHGTITFDLMTLTLKFDLLLKNFNLGRNFLTRRDRAFILHMCIPCDRTFHMVPWYLTLWPWHWSLTYFWKTLTLVATFLPEEIGLSYCTCVLLVTGRFTWYHSIWPWPWSLTYFWKTLTLAITFLLDEIGLLYCTCVFLVTRPFTLYPNFLPCDLDLEVWPTFEKL